MSKQVLVVIPVEERHKEYLENISFFIKTKIHF